MLDVLQILMTLVSVKAAMIGVAAAQAWNYFVPSVEPSTTSDTGAFSTTKGGWRARVTPLIAPIFATIACVAMEWDGKIVADDVARGILSGFASEIMLRFYYKTIKGL